MSVIKIYFKNKQVVSKTIEENDMRTESEIVLNLDQTGLYDHNESPYGTVSKKPPNLVCGLRFAKSKNTYKAANLVFDANKMEAYSYGWWKFVSLIGNKVVFNKYRYSVTTAKHQRKIENLFNSLSINYWIVECPNGLQDLESGTRLYEAKIKELETEIAVPRSQKLKNIQRVKKIKEYKSQIKLIQSLIKKAA